MKQSVALPVKVPEPAGIRLVAFIDAADVLHIIGVGPMPGDSS
jgi:hypothetical protein